ncbi:MAG: enoyl-CoA hydratase/isomerase family protein [Candidatus Atabeyarchaeum deiterrae]
MGSLVLVEKKDRLTKVILNREDRRNAFNQDLLSDLGAALKAVRDDSDCLGVIVTGVGPVFSSGLDLKAFQDGFASSHQDPSGIIRLVQDTFTALEDMEKPTLAAVNGTATGMGLELALACDFRIASDDCRLSLPEVCLGIMPDIGGAMLPKLVGLGIAKEIALTGQVIDAQRAERIGLVNKVVPPSELMVEAENFVRQIIENSPIAVRSTKTLMNKAFQLDPKTMAEYTIDLQLQCLKSNDLLRYAANYISKRIKLPPKPN